MCLVSKTLLKSVAELKSQRLSSCSSSHLVPLGPSTEPVSSSTQHHIMFQWGLIAKDSSLYFFIIPFQLKALKINVKKHLNRFIY